VGKRDKPAPAPPPAAPFNPALARLAGRLAGAPAMPAMRDPPAPAERTPPPGPARAVVRMERSGRGGKTVTVVEKLELRPRELEAWCSGLKRALGCGGAVEGGALVVQGDARERVARWLEDRGVRKVTVG
jgi:translation initiation factor 1